MVIIIFGVSGSGKTTVGKLLAGELGWEFYDADDFHSAANIEKMQAGAPLTDEDREPWLTSLRELIEQQLGTNKDVVLACSALKAKYRSFLRVSDQVGFVYLRGDCALVSEQLGRRHDHFMNPQLLQSQFADLQEPTSDENAIVIELGREPGAIVAEIKDRAGLLKSAR